MTTTPKSSNPEPQQAMPSAANFSDALTQTGRRFLTLSADIKPVTSTAKLFGCAFTVACYPGATYYMERAIEEARPGEVIVTDGRGYNGAVLMGGLMSGRAFYRGVAGVVIDGAVRDLDDMEQHGRPVFARSVVPAGGTHDQIGSVGEPITCGGVRVCPGDYIVGDEDGVVCVPREYWKETLANANAIREKETFIAKEIQQGRSLAEAVAQWNG